MTRATQIFTVLGFAAIVLVTLFGIFLDFTMPDTKTVIIHKQQDRVSLPCPEKGEGE